MNRLLFLMLCISAFLARILESSGQIIISNNHPSSVQVERAVIDSAVYKRWTHVEDARISNNGAYVSYVIKNDSMSNSFAAILTDGNGHWKRKLPNVKDILFTGDSRFAVYLSNDTLCIVRLGSIAVEKIPEVQFFFTPANGEGKWISFKYKRSDDLVLYNTHSGKRKVYHCVKNSSFAEDGESLVLQTVDSIDNSESVGLLELHSGRFYNIWKGKGLITLQTNATANSIVFIVSDGTGGRKAMWLYEKGSPGLDLLVNNKVLEIDSSWVLEDYVEISTNRKYISFSIRKSEQEELNTAVKTSTVNIWSYLDRKLQSLQLKDERQSSVHLLVINRDNHHITKLCTENESIISTNRNKDAYIIESVANDIDGGENSWNSAAQRAYYVKLIKDNRNILLKSGKSDVISFSPEGKYVIYYDNEASNYFTYEVATGIYRNITSGMNVSWNGGYREDLFVYPRGICAWGHDDKWILIYDKFDIWKIDPLGVNRPVNITNGYGFRNEIVFDLAFPELRDRVFVETDQLILNAINIRNKQNGFFQKTIGKVENPELLTMGNYIFELVHNPYLYRLQRASIKAKDANMYVVSRMSSTESPNYFLTDDFKQFKQLSYVYPEREFNWYNTELHTWRRPDGKIEQGVLYKPENFDSLKKYPVIFHYYEKKSFSLNEYLVPENISNGCNINIPTYVSNGYLVFTPDIDYVIGNPMQSACDAVVSAANYVSQLPFVRSDRMGVGGCSFGGAETNYLITHSNLFAAAYSASSICDLVSAYNDVPLSGNSFQSYFENGQGRMGVPLWEDPEKYIKNSAIFYVNKVTTPLLLMHTTLDVGASFSQALELYTALRRLGKKVWLLEYTDGNHAVWGKSAEDYAIRLNQFFDHYLKQRAAPIWMTRGIPAKLKGIDNGYELDSNAVIPENGLLMKSIQK